MPRFFCTEKKDGFFLMDENDSLHMKKSLRMKDGDEVTVSDTSGYDYECVLEFNAEGRAVCRIMKQKENDTEPSVKITLYQAMPKSDKLEEIVKKSVEIGVYEIVPIITNRCISRPRGKALEKKTARLKRISLSAAKQSGRGIIPDVREAVSFSEALKELSEKQMPIVFYENGGENLRDLDFGGISEIGIMIGSEGGFDLDEINRARELGINVMGLGKRILRCETAPLVALSALMLLTGNM